MASRSAPTTPIHTTTTTRLYTSALSRTLPPPRNPASASSSSVHVSSRTSPLRISVADVVRVKDLLDDLDRVVFDDERPGTGTIENKANTPAQRTVQQYPLWMKSDMISIHRRLCALQGPIINVVPFHPIMSTCRLLCLCHCVVLLNRVRRAISLQTGIRRHSLQSARENVSTAKNHRRSTEKNGAPPPS